MAVNDPTPPTPAPGDPGQPSNPAPNPPPTDPTPPPGDPEGESPSALKKALDSERILRQQHERDAKAKAKELEALKAEKQAREDAEKTEAQKAAERAEAAEKALSDMQGRMRQQSVRHAVSTAARDQGFINPDDAPKFLDLDTIEFDDAGEPQGIADRVKALATERPYLIKATTQTGPPPTPRSDRSGNEPTPDEQRAHDVAFRTHTRSRF